MADNLTISTGTGTTIATDQIGTAHFQRVKLTVGASDTASYLVFGQTVMSASLPVVIASNQSTLDVSVVAFTPGGTQNVNVVGPIYAAGSTSMGATGTGVIIIGLESGATTGRAIALTASGQQLCQVSTGTVAVSNTPTVTVSTALALAVTTGTVNVVSMPVISASNVSIASITAGTLDKVTLVSTVSTVLGTLAISGTATVIPSGTQNVNIVNSLDVDVMQYTVETTGIGSTGTGMLTLGIIGTTVHALAINTTGGLTYLDTIGNISTGTLTVSAGNIAVSNTPTVTVSNNPLIVTAANVTIASITAGTLSTVLAMPVLSATNITVASITAGTISTVLALPVLSATNVTIASITTGSVSIINTPVITATISNNPVMVSGSGLLLGATTGKVGAFVWTAHASAWNAYVVATTATSAILKTSGAHTLYVTDLLFSVDVPMNIDVRSATTAVATVYLATKGGFVFPMQTPMVLTSAQSLTFLTSTTGSCAGYAAGYTVT